MAYYQTEEQRRRAAGIQGPSNPYGIQAVVPDNPYGIQVFDEPLKEPGWGDWAITSALRTVPSIATSYLARRTPLALGMMATGGAQALGETWAEDYEVAQGLRRQMNPWQIATQGTIGGLTARIPTIGHPELTGTADDIAALRNYAWKPPVAAAAEGALTNAASVPFSNYAETDKWEMPSWGELGGAAAGGALFGAGTGAAFGSRPALKYANFLEQNYGGPPPIVPPHAGAPPPPAAPSAPSDPNFTGGLGDPMLAGSQPYPTAPPDLTGRPRTITIKDSVNDLAEARRQGYVSIPGLVNDKNQPIMVRADLAPLYRQQVAPQGPPDPNESPFLPIRPPIIPPDASAPAGAIEPLPGESLGAFQRRTKLNWSQAKALHGAANPPQAPIQPQVTTPVATATLPRDLAGASPRYLDRELQFTTDLDKSLYIIAQAKKSPRDADYLRFVMDQTGLDEISARGAGDKVRRAIGQIVKGKTTPGEKVTIPDIGSIIIPKGKGDDGGFVGMDFGVTNFGKRLFDKFTEAGSGGKSELDEFQDTVKKIRALAFNQSRTDLELRANMDTVEFAIKNARDAASSGNLSIANAQLDEVARHLGVSETDELREKTRLGNVFGENKYGPSGEPLQLGKSDEPSFENVKPGDDFQTKWENAIAAAEELGVDWSKHSSLRELQDANIKALLKQKVKDVDWGVEHPAARGVDVTQLRYYDPAEIIAKRKELAQLYKRMEEGTLSNVGENRVDQLLDELQEFDNMANMKPSSDLVEGGGYKASMNVEHGVENITRDYTSPLPGIMVREGMQNAMDAADKLGSDGTVKIRINSGEQTIEIYDNGSGMDDATLGGKFFEAFSTGKEGEEGATGGKGIGSASYIYGGQHFEIRTIADDLRDVVDKNSGEITRKADGRRYEIITSGTPQEFIKGKATFSRTPVSPDTPTGTTMKVKILDTHDMYDAKTMLRKLIANTRNRPSRIIMDEGGYTNDPLIDLEHDSTNQYADTVEHRFESSSNDKLIGDFTTKHRNSEVKVLVPPYDDSIVRSHIDVHYLNNGMYQFSEDISLGEKGDGAPEKILVDIHPLVDDRNELYPFINTREDIKKDIREEVTKFIKDNVSAPAVSRRKNRTQELYDSMSVAAVSGTKRKPVIYDPGNRLTPQEMETIVRSPVVQKLIQHYDSIIDNILGAVGRDKWINRLEGVGLVFDPESHGVHIPNPTTKKSTILINPFERIGQLNPKLAAWNNTITNLHEAGHIGAEHGMPVQFLPEDMNDPRFGEFVTSLWGQVTTHGDVAWASTGHGMDFAHRLGEVYAKFGVRRTFDAAAKTEAILTGGKTGGGYDPEIQRLLQLYKDSRGRDAVTEDLLSPTGVKQGDRGPYAAGGIPSDTPADGGRVAARIKDLYNNFLNGIDEFGDPDAPVSMGMGLGNAVQGVGKAWQRTKEATGWGQGVTRETRSSADVEKSARWLQQAINVPTNVTTTGDLSFPGRQGLSMIYSPKFWKATKLMFQAGASEKWAYMIDDGVKANKIHQKPVDPVTQKEGKSMAQYMGIDLMSVGDRVSQREEGALSRLLETGGNVPYLSRGYRETLGRIPRMSNRAFATMANVLRTEHAEKMLDLARAMSIEAETTGRGAMPGILGGIQLSSGKNLGFRRNYTPEQAQSLNPYENLVLAKEIGDFVNTATGRAPLKMHYLPFKGGERSMESYAGELGLVLFAPRNMFSKMRMLNPLTYIMASPLVRKQYMKSALATAATWYLYTTLAKNIGGDEVEIGNDPLSSDFGKVRFGDVRLDPGAGFLQFLVAADRLWSGKYVSSASNKEHQFGQGFREPTFYDVAERVVSNKLNPVAKFGWDLLHQSKGVPFHVLDRTAQMFVPLVGQDLWEIYKEDPKLLPVLAGPVMFGSGTQIYSRNESISKFVPPEHDWIAQGGGIQDLMPQLFNRDPW